jgi:hypothetical protein
MRPTDSMLHLKISRFLDFIPDPLLKQKRNVSGTEPIDVLRWKGEESSESVLVTV